MAFWEESQLFLRLLPNGGVHQLADRFARGRARDFIEPREQGQLAALLERETGQVASPSELSKLDASVWGDKGQSLKSLGHCEEAARRCSG